MANDDLFEPNQTVDGTESARKGPAGPRASQLLSAQPDGDLEAEVIVVGAGPAGASTAAFLARSGVDVLVVEKSEFPREKVCGDGLTPRAVRMLNRLGLDTSAESGWQRNKGLRVQGNYDRAPFELPWPELADFPNYGLVCPRSTFDDLIAGVAVSHGARMLTNTKVTGAILDGRTDRVVGVETGDGRKLRAPIVVAADGNSARLGVDLGITRNPKRPMGVAVRSYYTSPLHDTEWMESHLQLWDGKPGHSNLLPGYGWIFGLGDGTCNVGLGTVGGGTGLGNTNYKELMKRWLASMPEELGFTEENQVEPIRGAALPMAFNRKPFYSNGLVLVGDSGGMVSPFNGEGISYAMEAAEYAADAIVDASNRGFGTTGAERALARYPKRVAAEWGGYYRLGTVFVKLIGDPRIMNLCVTYGLPIKPLMRLVMKMLANLTDSEGGDWMDHLLNTAAKIAPNA